MKVRKLKHRFGHWWDNSFVRITEYRRHAFGPDMQIGRIESFRFVVPK